MASVPQALPGNWTAGEERALVKFIMTTTKGDKWPTTIKEKFWEAAAKFVSQRCSIRQRTCKHLVLLNRCSVSIAVLNIRIGGACRSRVTVNLCRKYSSPEEAERAMSIRRPIQAKEKRFSLTAALQSMEIAEHSVSCKYKIK